VLNYFLFAGVVVYLARNGLHTLPQQFNRRGANAAGQVPKTEEEGEKKHKKTTSLCLNDL